MISIDGQQRKHHMNRNFLNIIICINFIFQTKHCNANDIYQLDLDEEENTINHIKNLSIRTGFEQLKISGDPVSTIHQLGNYDYISEKNNRDIINSRKIMGAFFGEQLHNSNDYQWIVGMDYNQPTPIKYAGYLLQSQAGAPQEKFNFEYKLASKQVLLENKLYWHTSNYLDVLIMIGVGISQNKFYGFRTEAKNSSTSTLGFPNNTEIHISYAIGSGVRTMLSENFSLELLYRFSNYGKFTSKPGEIISEKTKFTQKQENISGQQVLLSLGYYW